MKVKFLFLLLVIITLCCAEQKVKPEAEAPVNPATYFEDGGILAYPPDYKSTIRTWSSGDYDYYLFLHYITNDGTEKIAYYYTCCNRKEIEGKVYIFPKIYKLGKVESSYYNR